MAEGKIVSLQLCVGHREPMNAKDQAVAVTGTGLEGDRHATLRAIARSSSWKRRYWTPWT